MENKRAHLEMLQGVINRLAGNSLLIKGWSVSLVAALLRLPLRMQRLFLSIWLTSQPAPFGCWMGISCTRNGCFGRSTIASGNAMNLLSTSPWIPLLCLRKYPRGVILAFPKRCSFFMERYWGRL